MSLHRYHHLSGNGVTVVKLQT